MNNWFLIMLAAGILLLAAVYFIIKFKLRKAAESSPPVNGAEQKDAAEEEVFDFGLMTDRQQKIITQPTCNTWKGLLHKPKK